jgi:hypothetical protein
VAVKEKTDADLLVGLPLDNVLAELGELGDSLIGIGPDNPSVAEIDRLLSEVGPK